MRRRLQVASQRSFENSFESLVSGFAMDALSKLEFFERRSESVLGGTRDLAVTSFITKQYRDEWYQHIVCQRLIDVVFHFTTCGAICVACFPVVRNASLFYDKIAKLDMEQISLDIETIPTVDEPDFDEPAHWMPFAVALGHRSDPGADATVDVIFRGDDSVEAEEQMLTDTFDWISSQINGSEKLEILTYNGDSYDFPILRHRASELKASNPGVRVDKRLSLLLEIGVHNDLILEMKEREGHWISLDDALNLHGIESDDPTWLDKPVTGSDMPSMGLELLTDRPNEDLRDVVRRYAESDVRPLFELYDVLNQEPRQRP